MLKSYERPRGAKKPAHLRKHLLQKVPFPRSRRQTWCCLCLVSLLLVAYYFYLSASTGIGGQSFAGILVQCVYKSYSSVESHQKFGEVYSSVSDVLTKHGQRWGQSAISSDFGTDKMDRHNYTLYYDTLLVPYREHDVNLLEVGVKKGGSIKMWRELFSYGSHIYGVDIDPGIPTFPLDAGIKTMVMDTSKPGVLTRAVSGTKFDVIIDDGDHRQSRQIATFRNLFTALKPSGVYIVEDVYHFGNFATTLHKLHPELRWVKLADRTMETYKDGESLVVIYPPESIASAITEGVMSKSG